MSITDPWAIRDQQARLERDGVLCISRTVLGWWFFVRPLTEWNGSYYAAIARMMRSGAVAAYAKKVAADPDYLPSADERELDKLMQINPFIEGCLVGWKNVTGRDGAPLEFTPDNARELFKHFPNVFAELKRFAQRPDITRVDEVALTRGNS